MANKLQIGIDLKNPIPGLPELHVTPIDIEVPDHVAAAAKTLQDFFDMQDVKPGDGQAEVPLGVKVPAFKVFGHTFEVPINGYVFLNVVQSPSAPAAA